MKNKRKSMENKKLYAVYMQRLGKENFITNGKPISLRKRNLIFCSSNQELLRGYINVFCIPFDKKETTYSLINIQPLIDKGIISRKNLSDITESFASSNLETEKKPLPPPPEYNGAFDSFQS